MSSVFTILVIALALFSIVAVMFLILREKVDHEAHVKYVRSPWNDDATDAPPTTLDAHVQPSDTTVHETVIVSEPEVTKTPMVEVTTENADDTSKA